MLTRPHSPTIWGLYAGAATFAGMLVATAVWNLYDRRADVRGWLKL